MSTYSDPGQATVEELLDRNTGTSSVTASPSDISQIRIAQYWWTSVLRHGRTDQYNDDNVSITTDGMDFDPSKSVTSEYVATQLHQETRNRVEQPTVETWKNNIGHTPTFSFFIGEF